jgi:hypothetical protein
MQEKQHINSSPHTNRQGFIGERMPTVQATHTSIRGSARFKVFHLYRSGRITHQLETGLRATPWIKSVNASTLTGTVLVLFDATMPVD